MDSISCNNLQSNQKQARFTFDLKVDDLRSRKDQSMLDFCRTISQEKLVFIGKYLYSLAFYHKIRKIIELWVAIRKIPDVFMNALIKYITERSFLANKFNYSFEVEIADLQ